MTPPYNCNANDDDDRMVLINGNGALDINLNDCKDYDPVNSLKWCQHIVAKVRLMLILDADVHDDYDEDEQSIKVKLMMMMKIGRKHFPC